MFSDEVKVSKYFEDDFKITDIFEREDGIKLMLQHRFWHHSGSKLCLLQIYRALLSYLVKFVVY